jgi:hypothetical protein
MEEGSVHFIFMAKWNLRTRGGTPRGPRMAAQAPDPGYKTFRPHEIVPSPCGLRNPHKNASTIGPLSLGRGLG